MAKTQAQQRRDTLEDTELISICENIIRRSKQSAHKDTGFLKRSISYVVNRQGVLTFTEVFYGQFNKNSRLEENIRSMLPSGVSFQLIYTDYEGNPYEVVRKSASGRESMIEATKATTKKSLGIGGIKNFLKGFINGKASDTTTNNSGSDNKKES